MNCPYCGIGETEFNRAAKPYIEWQCGTTQWSNHNPERGEACIHIAADRANIKQLQLCFDRANHGNCEKQKLIHLIGGMCGAVREPTDILRDIAKMCAEEI